MSFTERIGGVLVAPRKTFARLAAGAARPSDVAWLLILRLVAGELDRFAHAIAVGREFGPGAALQEILTVSTTVLPDVIGILAAGMLLQLFSRAKNAFDVAAYVWIPYLAVQLAGALYFTARRYPPSPRALSILEGAGVAWALAVFVVALLEARKLEVPA
jgi:Na+-transporting NADH:ubiquinone oxidoreductase subunit NqrE